MRASQYLIATQKETPSDAVVVSHQLMLRAGMIRKSASGLYSWLPLGLKVLRKVEAVIREEMNRVGAQEVLMPVVQPASLWMESGRWDVFGAELTRFSDRHNNDFCLGPTHEEIITDIVRNELKSYKQLPASFYQIQTKFRDEVRPRFGVMRSREFIMKDAYSFHSTQASLETTYQQMYQAYSCVFDRLGLTYRAVLADTGSIGGTESHEFHVLAESGEDDIVFSNQSQYAANIEMAEALPPVSSNDHEARKPLAKVPTPGQNTVEELTHYLKIPDSQMVKTLIVLGEKDAEGTAPLMALVVRGDHSLNEVKAAKVAGIAVPLTFANDTRILQELGADTGSLGPLGLSIPVVVDRAAAACVNFACGANETGFHFTNANWTDDTHFITADLRNVQRGDPSPDGHGTLDIKRGIEVGHIFQLGTKYSEAMKASVLDENGKDKALSMGCYGIGVSRIVAAAIEQNNDQNGIIWPQALAPFQVVIIPINLHKSDAVKQQCEHLYTSLQDNGCEVLFMDEAKARLGGMLADSELIGIPHRLVIGERGLKDGTVEYKGRRDSDSQNIGIDSIINFLQSQLA